MTILKSVLRLADGIPIYGISQIKEKIKDADVKTAILTVPSVKSQEVANLIGWCWCKKAFSVFLLFTCDLPKDVVVQYVDLTSELQTLLYFMRKED